MARAIRELNDSAVNMPPDPDVDSYLDSLATKCPCKLPDSIRELYRATDGLSGSSCLPGKFDGNKYLTFSLIPARELADWYQTMCENDGGRRGIWRSFPHWMRTLTIPDDAEGLWNPWWIPFATDGGAAVQFVSGSFFGGVFEYTPSTFSIRKCARTLNGYFSNVMKRVVAGNLETM